MKIEIVEKLSKDSYHEILSVVLNYYKVRKNPYKKVNLIIPFLKILLFCILLMSFFIILYTLIQKPLNLFTYFIQTFIKGLFFLILFLFFFNLILKKSLKSKLSVVIDDTGIEQRVNDKQDLKIQWNNIKVIIINKHSICVIPNSAKLGLLGLDIIHKEEFLSALFHFNKQNLILDNSNLY